MSEAGLQVRNLRTHFFTRKAWPAPSTASISTWRRARSWAGGRIGLGQDRHGFSILGLIDPPGRIVEGSSIRFAGEELTKARPERLRAIRARRSP